MTQTDPFAAPAEIPSSFPGLKDLNGRLLLIKPTAFEKDVPAPHLPKQNGRVVMQDRITADVTVLDGEPLADYAGETEFPGMYLSQSRVVNQLRQVSQLGGSSAQTMVLGRVGLYKPDQIPGAGNPWGLKDPTEEDKAIARAYLTRAPKPADPWA